MGIPARGLRPEGSRFRIDLTKIAPNPRNPRDDDDWVGEEFEAFADNLESVGAIHDAVVCALDAYLGKYPRYASEIRQEYPEAEVVLLAGEGRWRAHLAKNAAEMTVVMRNALLEQGDFIFMSENGRRRNLNPLQEGLLCWRAHHEDGLSYEEIARRSGMSGGKSRISKLIALHGRFPDGSARDAIRRGALPAEGAYHLLTNLKDPALIEQAFTLIEKDQITARQAVRTLLGVPSPSVPESPVPVVSPAEPVGAQQNGGPAPLEPQGEAVSPAKPEEPRKEGNGQEDGSARGSAGEGLRDAAPPNAPTNPSPGAAATDLPGRTRKVSLAKQRGGTGQTASRMAAIQRTLTSRDYDSLQNITVRLAAVVLATARGDQRHLAATAAQLPYADSDVTNYDELAERNPADLVRLADAVAFALAELHLRAHPAAEWTPREADYLRQIIEAGYEPTPEENDFLSVSPAKLPTLAEAAS
ncbi:hypothetical protein OG339_48230 (plasmid) [Streptosporangium sp. NBC_01495]|uniref:ParB/RepB/Spo0J family partition protein n=1 Tax=Streptosporangium sp. NBC_01495 TaxID=2903899 RepID=UPI002E2F1474|nr:hypothetical protein [Streptosporangium sp. NBC_01495]